MEQLHPASAGCAGGTVRGPLRHGGVRGDQHTTSSGTAAQPPGLDKRDELDDATDSSDDDDRRRRRGTVKAFALDEIPSASGFRKWSLHTYSKVASALKDSQIKTSRWLQKVDSCKQVAELEAPGRKWDELDAALAEAVLGVAEGSLKR